MIEILVTYFYEKTENQVQKVKYSKVASLVKEVVLDPSTYRCNFAFLRACFILVSCGPFYPSDFYMPRR